MMRRDQSVPTRFATPWARDDFPTVVLGMGHVGIKLTAPAEIIEFVTRYTDGYFVHNRTRYDAHLVVHASLSGGHDPSATGLSAQLRTVPLPGVPDVTCVADDTQAVVHVFVPLADKAAGVHTVRLLRAMLLNQLLLAASPFIHAACVAFAGAGVAFAGPRGSGKTTLLLHATAAGAAIVGNDKIALAAESGHVDALGFPVKIGVRAGSMLTLGQGPLRAFLETQWDHQTDGLPRSADDLRTRIFVRTQDLAEAARSSILPRCRLVAIIEPSLQTSSAASPGLEPLSRQEAAALLDANALRGPTQVFPQQAALAAGHHSEPAALPDIPAYRLTCPTGSGRGSIEVIRDLIGSASQIEGCR